MDIFWANLEILSRAKKKQTRYCGCKDGRRLTHRSSPCQGPCIKHAYSLQGLVQDVSEVSFVDCLSYLPRGVREQE